MVGDLSTGDIAYHTNRDTDGPVKLVPGTYGISNGTLNSAWRKVLVGKDALQVMHSLYIAACCCCMYADASYMHIYISS